MMGNHIPDLTNPNKAALGSGIGILRRRHSAGWKYRALAGLGPRLRLIKDFVGANIRNCSVLVTYTIPKMKAHFPFCQ